jgi:hypothetical protein
VATVASPRYDTEDGLPDERGCVRLVEAFWAQMRADLESLPHAIAAANHAGEEMERLERRYPMRQRTPEQAKEIRRAGARWEGHEKEACDCIETARWVLDDDAADMGSLRYWCDLSGTEAATVRQRLREEFPRAFALLP